MDKRLVLGLDVSTTTIGVCLMLVDDNKRDIVKLTHISPKVNKNIKGIESLFLKKHIFEDEFLKDYIGVGITDVVIEEPLLGSNNIYTIATLLRFNGMISDSIYRNLGIVPTYISSYDARANAFPELLAIRKFNKKGEVLPPNKIKKSKAVLFGDYPFDIDKKRVIFDKISELYPDLSWIKDKNGELTKQTFDASDALCCILGQLNKEKSSEL